MGIVLVPYLLDVISRDQQKVVTAKGWDARNRVEGNGGAVYQGFV
jgi:hypothetical protein